MALSRDSVEQIRALSEEEMLRVAEEYARATEDTLHKVIKEISTKCYETTFSLKAKKTIGFGRNQREASVNSLRKLIESIVSNPLGVRIINETMGTVTSHEENIHEGKMQMDLIKFDQKNKNPFTNLHKTKIALVSKAAEPREKAQLLKRSFNQRHSVDNAVDKQNTESLEAQLAHARVYISQLEEEVLQLRKLNNRQIEPAKGRISLQPRPRILSEINIQDLENIDSNEGKKKIIPKLNLESLPNFHGNSRSKKSLNQSLILAPKKK